MSKVTHERNKWMRQGLVLLAIGVLVAVVSYFLLNFHPVKTTRSYIAALKSGDLAVLRNIGPGIAVDQAVNALGENYLRKVKLAESIYYKNGFEIWAFLEEKVWKLGRSRLGWNEADEMEKVVHAGFDQLSNDEKASAGSEKLFLMNGPEMPGTGIAPARIAMDIINYVNRDGINFRDAITGFSSDKLDFIKKMADRNTSREYKEILAKYDGKISDERKFVKTEGERILKERLREKYRDFNLDSFTCIYVNYEFANTPFRGDEAYVLGKNTGGSALYVFKLSKNGFLWKVTGIPGNSL